MCERNSKRQLSKSLVLVGKMVGSAIFGQLADVVGRKTMFLLGIVMQVRYIFVYSCYLNHKVTVVLLTGCSSADVHPGMCISSSHQFKVGCVHLDMCVFHSKLIYLDP